MISVDAKNDKVVLRVDDERGVKLAFTTGERGAGARGLAGEGRGSRPDAAPGSQ